MDTDSWDLLEQYGTKNNDAQSCQPVGWTPAGEISQFSAEVQNTAKYTNGYGCAS